jgi:hypothetical protein
MTSKQESGTHPTRSLDVKPTYETPTVVPLGELARGLGQTSCHSGTNASNCKVGYAASGSCNDGTHVFSECQNGTSPAANCNQGFQFLGLSF